MLELFLFTDWFFWSLVGLSFILVYITLGPSKRSCSFSPWSVTWTVLIIALVAARWHKGTWVTPTWTQLAWWTVAYTVAGFFVSLYKYLAVLHDFRSDAPKFIKEYREARRHPGIAADAREDASSHLTMMLGLPFNAVELSGSTYTINWKAFPIALWWVYWPCFILSVILDPINRAIKELVARMRRFYQALAKKFSVTA